MMLIGINKYIEVLKILFDDANEYTIKVYSSAPSYSNIQRHVRLIKSYGYDKLFYTCVIDDKDLIKKIEYINNIKIYDKEDTINRCIENNRLDLLEIIE